MSKLNRTREEWAENAAMLTLGNMEQIALEDLSILFAENESLKAQLAEQEVDIELWQKRYESNTGMPSRVSSAVSAFLTSTICPTRMSPSSSSVSSATSPPENLCCNGELRGAALERKHKRLLSAQAALRTYF
jgi:hypothetical protein